MKILGLVFFFRASWTSENNQRPEPVFSLDYEESKDPDLNSELSLKSYFKADLEICKATKLLSGS